jgi:hypothetical protein
VSFQSRSVFPHGFRWTDPHTWPWIVWVWAGFLLLGWIAPLWKWFQRDRVKSWPAASGYVESIGEPEPRKFLGLTIPQTSSQGILEIHYSYSALGQSFRGRHKLDSSSKFNPDEFTNRLVRSPVLVQYHPEKPSISALLDSSIEALLRQAPPPSQEEEKRIRAAHEIPAIYRPWLQPLMYLALAGFLISLWINIACVLGKQIPSDAPLFLMHIGIFVVFIPATLTGQKMLGGKLRRDFWKAVMKDAPEAYYYLFYIIFAYSWLTGVYAFFSGFPGNGQPSTPSSGQDWLVFSGVWMIFYYASFAIFLSARNSCFKYAQLPDNSQFSQ